MTPKNILVPIDFSQPAERALDYACSLGATLGATVHVIHALDAALPELTVTLSDAMLASLRDGAQNAVNKLLDPRRALVAFGETIISVGDPRDMILNAAENLGADLIIMGTHGRRGLSRMFLGSVAEDVSRRSPCPVLLVRMKKDAS